jgi:hypothetical protein
MAAKLDSYVLVGLETLTVQPAAFTIKPGPDFPCRKK